VSAYRDRLAEWARDVAAEPDLSRWDRVDMWSCVVEQNPRINGNVLMKRFVDDWLDAVRTGTTTVADNESLRSLVGSREKLVKRAQSRQVNDKLLRAWSLEPGSVGRLVHRRRRRVQVPGRRRRVSGLCTNAQRPQRRRPGRVGTLRRPPDRPEPIWRGAPR
jgi:hypothetical protein